MATHSSVLAWRIPAMGEPGGLPTMGSLRVGHGWSDLARTRSCSSVLASGNAFSLLKWLSFFYIRTKPKPGPILQLL